MGDTMTEGHWVLLLWELRGQHWMPVWQWVPAP
jgi:hypothetical protein